MPQIVMETEIDADIDTCFDLARDVGFYKNTLESLSEIPISGKTRGRVEQGDYITWETNHMNLMQHLTLEVTEFKKPFLFVDDMVKGEFKSYRHEHIFEIREDRTIMIDKLFFESPYGILGTIVDALLLKGHMQKKLQKRNAILKQKAESLSLNS